MYNSFPLQEKDLKFLFSGLHNFKTEFALFLQGLYKFNNIEYKRDLKEPKLVWQKNNVKLLHYKGKNSKKKILFIPSIINKYYILDLKRKRSLARFLSKEYSVYILDWGQAHESINSLEDYIKIAVEVIKSLASSEKITLIGYCLGGVISIAASVICKNLIDSLALLATPWDFNKLTVTNQYIGNYQTFKQMTHTIQTISSEFIQSMFFAFQTKEIFDKFICFNNLKKPAVMNLFVAVEHWIKDGNDLSKKVIIDLVENFSINNITCHNKWFIKNKPINLSKVNFPVFVAIPTKDKIVPIESTLPILTQIERKTIVEIDTGHIGMIIGSKSKLVLWKPLKEWLDTAS
ncbi:MAG: alpha/beta fold hydrolase [Alphaproteobacteria bacterium]